MDESLVQTLIDSNNGEDEGDARQIVYRLLPIRGGTQAGPWSDGEKNCVLSCVETLLKARGALTPRRRSELAGFHKKLDGSGCSTEDLKKLETALQVKLVLSTVEGDPMFESG